MEAITIKAGDTPTISLAATDSNGAAIDITGYASASLKIAKSFNVANGSALYYVSVLAINFSDGLNGKHDFVPSEDITKTWPPGNYMYQTRLIDASNTVTSTDVGPFIVEQNLIDHEV